ncbi:MAG TPA: hypothetical protein VK742_16885 [Candidatus Sulfotelmatobacter sp.]|jgi:tetratricopeptide (TPR) repeat protein|nr:hypothetical protein [Candidatus Sulfotelmatobacter sp.]
MRKTAYLYFGLAVLLAIPAAVRAQDNAAALAVQQAVLNQAKTKELREKLADASAAEQRNDITGAAKIYQESVSLAQEIGSTGIEPLSAAAIGGLARTALALARDAQSRQDYYEADTQVKRVLKADPKNPDAIAFQAQNDELIEQNRGRQADVQTASQMPVYKDQKIQAATYLQDGKLLYEAGKLDEADAKLAMAQKLDADLPGVYYYQNLIKQTRNHRELEQHTVDTQERMNMVERRWVLPQSTVNMPSPNPYATNDLIYTGTGRQGIEQKLGHIRFDSVSFDGPLSAVLDDLQKLTKLRDPEHKGVNFMINPNPDQSGPEIAAPANGGFGGAGGLSAAPAPQPAPTTTVDPATGLPVTTAAAGGEKVDISTAVTVKLNLTDVLLADLLEAIIMVAEHPDGHQLKYSVTDYGVVFADKGAESPLMFTRTFKVDPNTFYSGLESVGASSFGSVSSSGGGSSGSSGGGGSSSQNNGAVVGVVNAFSGASQLRSSGGSGGGGGGGSGQGAVNPLNASGAGGTGGAGGGVSGQGGLNYITQVTLAQTPSAAARAFFSALGVNLLQPPGKAVFFNDRSGIILVRATEQDLDTIDQAIQVLNAVPPQVHIKARFIEVEQDDNNQFGLDWYLGQFNIGRQVVGSGGTAPSINVPTSAANPSLGPSGSAFPGNTLASLIPGSATDQILTSGLRNTGPAVATITGILTDPNFRVVLHALEQRTGSENLGEPEVTTTSGRQTQMRATSVLTIIYGYNFQQGQGGISTGSSGGSTP